MALEPQDFEVIERLLYAKTHDLGGAVARSCALLERKLDRIEERLGGGFTDIEVALGGYRRRNSAPDNLPV